MRLSVIGTFEERMLWRVLKSNDADRIRPEHQVGMMLLECPGNWIR